MGIVHNSVTPTREFTYFREQAEKIPKNTRITVIGGGLAGYYTCYLLQKKGYTMEKDLFRTKKFSRRCNENSRVS